MAAGLDLNNPKDVCAWLARLLDCPPSLVKDDLESMRWDIAHFFFQDGCIWHAAQVVAGNLTPDQHGRREESTKLYEKVAELYVMQDASGRTKEAFRTAMQEHYDCMNVEVAYAS
jgi:hypothetical protein